MILDMKYLDESMAYAKKMLAFQVSELKKLKGFSFLHCYDGKWCDLDGNEFSFVEISESNGYIIINHNPWLDRSEYAKMTGHTSYTIHTFMFTPKGNKALQG